MATRAKPSFTELKVGIFVLVTCIILGAAIFTIGTTVGLLEETFYAKTYLNNVSGLKPGDLVLLAGVEVGNVTDVRISESDDIPATESNQASLRQIEALNQREERLQEEISTNEENLRGLREEYDQAVAQYGEEAPQVEALEEEVADLEQRIASRRGDLEDTREDTGRVRGNLQNIVVSAQIKSEYRDWIKRDSHISLGSIGLLGDKYIEISLGRSTEPPLVVDEETEGWLGTSTQEVVLITGTTQPGFQELITGADNVLANLSVLSDKVNSILSPLSEGEGSLGEFIGDTSFYENLNQAVVKATETVDQATQLIQEFRQGEGTLAQLVQEQEVYDKINAATGHLENVLAQVDRGEGSVGKFINDPSVYDKTASMVASIDNITRRMDQGDGTLGKLSTDDQLYQNLDQSLDRFAAFVNGIQEGEGTLGLLAKDEKLYENLNQLSAEMVKLLYDFRQNPKEFLTIKLDVF
jgi:phospholipid/cholesterol/gamma-HCH transport system substrate-binding protein